MPPFIFCRIGHPLCRLNTTNGLRNRPRPFPLRLSDNGHGGPARELPPPFGDTKTQMSASASFL
eukprot:9439052-Lingulodinium_polyedra.AAC.1